MDAGGSDDGPLCSLLISHVLLFFSFTYQGECYSCALIEWFLPISDKPNDLTGMWIVAPEMKAAGQHVQAVISVKTILQGAHLIGVYGKEHLPASFHFSKSLDAFNAYYVNKCIDHHLFTLCWLCMATVCLQYIGF